MKIKILPFFFISLFCFSELNLEITKGANNPFSIAIIGFNENQRMGKEVLKVIKNDLLRTGEFNIFNEKDLLSIPKKEEDINFKDFKLLNMDYLIIGSIQIEDQYNIVATYDVYNVKRSNKIRNSKVFGIPKRIRQLSHYISDGIYEEITGIKGVSSTKLLYVSQTIGRKNEEVYKLLVSDADGANEQILLNSNEPIISPTWSPDSSRVAYVSFETGVAKVYIQELRTGKRELALESKYQISSPSWSPDGKYLSLTLYQDKNAEIYILNLKNKNLTRLTNHYSIDTESSWSSKGNKILFTSGRSGSPQLYEINLRKFNSKPKRITFEGNYNAKGSYLPNNEGIVFVHRSNGNFIIALKYFDENFIRPLSESKLDESPSISPNGNVIIYAITEDKKSLLAGLSLSGTRFRLPLKDGEVREPSWSGFIR